MSWRYWNSAVILLAVLSCLDCSSGSSRSPGAITGRASDAAAIRAARALQNQAMAEGAIARASEFWTEDVTLRRGLGASAAGRDAYRQLMQSDLGSSSRMIYERTPTEVTVSKRWPLGIENGTWTARLAGAPSVDLIAGRYAAQWVKRDGRWLIRSEVFVALTCRESGCEAVAVP